MTEIAQEISIHPEIERKHLDINAQPASGARTVERFAFVDFHFAFFAARRFRVAAISSSWNKILHRLQSREFGSPVSAAGLWTNVP